MTDLIDKPNFQDVTSHIRIIAKDKLAISGLGTARFATELL
jgi:hypothetical protein